MTEQPKTTAPETAESLPAERPPGLTISEADAAPAWPAQHPWLSPWRWMGLLCALLLSFGALRVVSWATVAHTLVGMLGAAVGGVAMGVTAWRFLGHNRTPFEAVYGFGAVSAIGLVAIGTLYLGYLGEPFESIGTVARAVEQTLIFVAFLIGGYAGALWAPTLLRRWRE